MEESIRTTDLKSAKKDGFDIENGNDTIIEKNKIQWKLLKNL